MKTLENKLPPPIILGLTALGMLIVVRVGPEIETARTLQLVVAGTLAIGALSVAGLAVRAFKKAQTTIDPIHPDRASTVVTTGIFAVTRNPMYLGMATLLTAWAVFLSTPWVFVGPLAFVLFITRYQIRPEERILKDKFGQGYVEYCQRVRRWM